MKEHALRLGKDRSIVGILTEETIANFHEENNLIGVLLLNAGVLHHVGPSRIYVKMARRLAAEGFVVVRFDFSGLGDSGPRRDKMPAVESVIDETRQVMDYLGGSKGIKQFCCVGLCDGAVTAARVCVSDPRVRQVVLINPVMPRTQKRFLIEQSNLYFKHAFFRGWSWLRLLSMESNYPNIWRVLCSEIRRKIHWRSHSDNELQEVTGEIKKFFRSIRAQGVKMLTVYSEAEFGDEYLQIVLGDEYHAMKNANLLRAERLMRSDHLVTPIACQEELLDLVSSFLTRNGAP